MGEIGDSEYDKRFEPFYQGLEYTPPNAFDDKATELLLAAIDSVAPLETQEALLTKSEMLEMLQIELNKWTINKLESHGVMFDTQGDTVVACKVLVSGSYRLGVTTQGSDIDCVCCIPQPLTREEFFSEEDGVVKLLRGLAGMTYVNPVTGAKVPIIEAIWNEVDFDVNCAIVSKPVVPQQATEVLDDQILVGMDEVSRICINGPRVTEMMAKLVPNMVTFRLALRVVRFWAKRRALYSNKMGFLGGVNWALLCVFTCQLYPRASPAKVVKKFFEMYCVWKWPTPIYLNQPYEVVNMEEVQNWVQRPIEMMPIITPAFPMMNSSFNVTKANLNILLKEFQRGLNFCNFYFGDKVEKAWLAAKEAEAEAEDKGGEEGQEGKGEVPYPDISKETWAPLFKRSEYFDKYNTYIVITAKTPNQDRLENWSGYVESRVRIMIHELDRFSLMDIYPYPAKFNQTRIIKVAVPKESEENDDQVAEDNQVEAPKEEVDAEKHDEKEQEEEFKESEMFTNSWFVAIRPHPVNSVRNGTHLDLTSAAARWKVNVEKWPQREEGMDLEVTLTNWKGLPDDPFLFPDGKAAHKKSHKSYMQKVKLENQKLRGTSGLAQEEEEAKPGSEKIAGSAENPAEVADEDAGDTGEKAEMDKQLQMMGKRALDAAADIGTNKMRKIDNNFTELPAVPGIDTTAPLKLVF